MVTAVKCLQSLFVLALCPPLVAGDCPVGARPFPSNLEGVNLQYANLFNITYHGTYKVIRYSRLLSQYSGYHPTRAGESIPEIVLYQCGTPRPEYGDAGISGSGLRFFEIPIQRATLPWGGALPFFELLSVTEAIYSMDLTYISSPCAQLMEECLPSVQLSQYDANFLARASNNSVVFTDSFGTGASLTSMDVEFQVSLDPGILNRAEWINYVGAFFNLETESAEIFSRIEADYNALKDLALQLKQDSSNEWGGREPKVLWVDYQPETCLEPALSQSCSTTQGWVNVGGWCHCGTVWKGNSAHYKRNLVHDAGGVLVSMPQTLPAGCTMATNTDGSQILSCTGAEGLASFTAFLAEADVIVDESRVSGHSTTLHDFEGAFQVTANEIPALARNPRNIFRFDGVVSDPRGASGTVGMAWNDWAKAEPQQLLAGVMEMLWSTSFESACGMKYFRRAINGQGQTVLGHDDCPYYDAGGQHSCSAIHDHLHQVVQCAPTATTTTTLATMEANTATARTLSAMVALCSVLGVAA